MFCHRNENDHGFVVFCADLSFHRYVYRTLEIGTYKKNYRGLHLKDGQFFSITTERQQFRIRCEYILRISLVNEALHKVLKITVSLKIDNQSYSFDIFTVDSKLLSLSCNREKLSVFQVQTPVYVPISNVTYTSGKINHRRIRQNHRHFHSGEKKVSLYRGSNSRPPCHH